eukprot:CAMPEP_0116937214 /NCGR_PEP_ID=MMETSP0467-20121206/31361_1 /TAXON_ID=283647 /ORGANISM="Mesodinium pulex, Strain SPMC105" /LENGTH=70 /DNA_ID=CAMNT_0004618967 /DNA_START=465 /DNA_END=677 /DNA_ORIENTATION=-
MFIHGWCLVNLVDGKSNKELVSLCRMAKQINKDILFVSISLSQDTDGKRHSELKIEEFKYCDARMQKMVD